MNARADCDFELALLGAGRSAGSSDALFEQAPIGIGYLDRAGRFLRCNASFGHLLELTPGEILGRSVGDLSHPDDAARTVKQLESLWSGAAECVDDERRYLRSDGSVVWVRATVALVRDGGGSPSYAVEFLRDITARKDLAAALVSQQTLLAAVLAEVPVALLVCDADGAITHFNRAAVELHCVSDGACTAAAPLRHADGETHLRPDEHPLERARRGEIVSNLEVVVHSGDAPRTILASARRLAGPHHQPLGAVAVMQDTTERRRADLEIERVHKQLLTASREAGMAEVATNVLHNVGNILNSVNISASLVSDRIKQSKAPGVARVAALLREQGGRLAEFLAADERGKLIPQYLSTLGEQLNGDQQLTLLELDSLRENLEHIKETVTMQQSYAKLCGVAEIAEVADLVEDSLRLNAGAFVRHGVTLCREFAAVPAITVDRHKVLQILVNLVRNAKYACDESGRTDKLLTLRIGEVPNGVSIAVIDNGVGIAADNMPRLFTHGFTTRQSGHGFGLHSGAVAAQELGGSLRAQSDGPGCGAAFILELPYQPPGQARA